MSNEHLKAAIAAAGLTAEQLADRLEVDAKTIGRWLAGRTPYPRHRARIAEVLGRPAHELWPDTDTPPPAPELQPDSDLIAAYPDAQHPDAPDWRELLESAREQVDVLDLTLAHIIHADGIPDLLADKVQRGCRVRLLLSEPESAHLWIVEQERAPDATPYAVPALARETHDAQHVIRRLLGRQGIEARAFVAPDYHTSLRADEQLLVRPHLYATPTEQAPVLHLRRHSTNGLFDRYVAHFDAIWRTATPLTPART